MSKRYTYEDNPYSYSSDPVADADRYYSVMEAQEERLEGARQYKQEELVDHLLNECDSDLFWDIIDSCDETHNLLEVFLNLAKSGNPEAKAFLNETVKKYIIRTVHYEDL